ncbi:hypothetical protein ACFVRD_37530 [Streptomyces sp. NPDC057908]|uniref:hypothetical protein n=1 Tax=Streptomyces sp. NPDC057908 TaxID=3346276 RepID=UPI0036EC353E
MCWCQARAEARATGRLHGSATAVHFLDGVGRHQQLFFADMLSMRGARTTPPRRYGRRGAPRKPPPPPAARPYSRWVQPVLFAGVRREYHRFDPGRANAGSGWLAWARHLAHGLAEARGWPGAVRQDVDLVMLLSEYAEADMIRHSEIFAPLRALNLSIERTTEVLQTMEIFLDDRRPSFEDWLESKLDGLALGIRRETEQWSRTLHDGGPRTLARDPSTVKIYLKAIRPVLLEWSAGHDHLREVTRDEVVAHVRTLQGRERHQALVALRSLFSWAKKNGVVFRNPTFRIKVGQAAAPVLQPLLPNQVARAAEAVTSPGGRLAVALAAVHAARPGAIRTLQLDDTDLGNRRLTIAGRSRPLDDLTRQLLLAWLEYRRRRWPNTANPHLIINMNTALTTGPVSSWWIERELRGQGATLDRLRIDRQLEEALVHGPDALHLAEVFGMADKTAIRYADSARALLEQAAEQPPQ